MDAMRIVDANANRAREALRTLEDAARFLLDDGALSESAKTIRHGLVAALEPLGPVAVLAARDVRGDVGTRITTEAERTRSAASAVAAAAGARLGESLRSIEEWTKSIPAAVDAGVPAAVESLRYRGYELERAVRLGLSGRRRPQWQCCVLLTASACRRPVEDVAEAAIAGGADCLQVREPEAGARALLDRARRIVEIAGGRASVVVNDRPDVALAADADGVHVGQGDLPASEVRRLSGTRLVVGVSTSRIAEARAALAAGADLCGVGPMHPSGTKAKDTIVGPAYLAEYLAWGGLPHLAIGGIDAERAAALAAAGARGVAVCGAVCGADDPEAATRAIVEVMDAAVVGDAVAP